MKISIVIFAILAQISAIKFGYLLENSENVLNEKFVAFGSIPAALNDADKQTMSNDLNRFYRYYQKDKERTSIPQMPATFTVTLFEQATLPDGNLQVALKGDLSNFLALFRMNMFNSLQSPNPWSSVHFYSDPIVIMSREALARCPYEIHVKLLRAAFDTIDIVPNNYLEIVEPPRTFSQIANDPNMHPNSAEIYDFEDEDDDSRYTVLEFFPSTGSLQYPLVDPAKSKRTIKPKNHRKSRCVEFCSIS